MNLKPNSDVEGWGGLALGLGCPPGHMVLIVSEKLVKDILL